MFVNTTTSGDGDDESGVSGVNGGVRDVRMTRDDACDGECGRVDMSVAASGASMAASVEVYGEVSGAKCDLNASGGYDSETCDAKNTL